MTFDLDLYFQGPSAGGYLRRWHSLIYLYGFPTTEDQAIACLSQFWVIITMILHQKGVKIDHFWLKLMFWNYDLQKEI